jgi:hypothetical protein
MTPIVNVSVETKYIVFGLAGLIALFGLVGIGYVLGQDDPEIVCKHHIARALALKTQVEDLEIAVTKSQDVALLKCVERENELCLKKIEDLGVKMRKLRCKICKVKKN